MALVITKQADVTSEDVIYRDPEGKTLIVNLTVSKLKLCVIVTHAPHDDKKQEAYFRDMKRCIPGLGAGRQVVWMGDFNFTETPAIDTMPQARAQHHPRALAAFHEVCGALKGLTDAYRAIHGNGSAVTHYPDRAGGTNKRLDRIYISSALAKTNWPGLADSEHVDPSRLSALGGNGKLHTSDHAAVQLTLRFGDEEQPKAPWRFNEETLKTREGNKWLDEAEQAAMHKADAMGLDISAKQLYLQQSLAKAGEQRERKLMRERCGKRQELSAKIQRLRERVCKCQAGTKEHAYYKAMVARCEEQIERLERTTQAADRREERRTAFSKEDRGGSAHFKPLRKPHDQTPIMHMQRTTTDDQGVTTTTDLREHKEIAEHLRGKWKGLFNLGIDLSSKEARIDKALESIRKDPMKRVSSDMAKKLSIQAILSESNIARAINSLRKGSVPGQDGLSIEYYVARAKTMVPHLRKLFLDLYAKGEMTAAMREAVITLIFKGKGERHDWKAYRPVSVTAIEYRILGRAIHLQLKPMMATLLGESQLGFIFGRQIDENVLCVSELARYCEGKGRGGLFAMLDATKAYDRVQWPFMQKVLRAYGFPDEFCSLIAMMYTNISSSLKVNGIKGEAFGVTNGLRQGCSLSCMLYVLCHEVFLRMIREDKKLKGIMIPGPRGEMARGKQHELRERAFADDTGVALANDAQLKRLFEIVAEYDAISGSENNESKTVILRMGTCKRVSPPPQYNVKWCRYGEDEMPSKYLGVRYGTATMIKEQWETVLDQIEAECNSAMANYAPRSIFGRAQWIKAVFASKAWYTFRFQTPNAAGRKALLKRFQRMVNSAYFGGFSYVTHDLARQEYEDGGLKMLDVTAHLQGEWVKLVRMLMQEPGEIRPWKHFWFHSLNEVYGDLDQGQRLITSTCKFEKLRKAPAQLVSEVQRAAFEAWGSLGIQPMARLEAEHEAKQKQAHAEKERRQRQTRRAAAPGTPRTLVVYSDGSKLGNDPKAGDTGYGVVVVQGGDGRGDAHATEVMREWAPTGRGTNQTAELEGGIAAMEWLLNEEKSSRPVVLRYDSEYAEGITIGAAVAQDNTDLALRARTLWRQLHKQRRGAVSVSHVAAHEAHKWNEVADTLAKRGARGSQGRTLMGAGTDETQAEREETRRGQQARKKQTCRKAVAPKRSVPALTYEEAVQMPLFFGLHEEASVQRVCRTKQEITAERKRQLEREQEAGEWATSGLTRVEHLLDATQRKLVTQAEFRRRHPGLRVQTYAARVKTMSAKQVEAISKGRARLFAGDWVWLQDRNRAGLVVLRQGQTVVIQPHVRGAGAWLIADGQTVQRTEAGLERCAVWTTTPKDEKKPKTYQLAGSSIAQAMLDPRDVGVRWRSGLMERPPISVDGLKVRQVKAINAAEVWKLPRAFEDGEVHAEAVQDASEQEKREIIARAFKLAKRTVLPRYLRETRYKALVSGFLVGARRQRGAKAECAHCRRAGRTCEESMRHMLAECPRAKDVWTRVLKAWERATGEVLDPNDTRVTLLGDRSEGWKGGRTCFEYLEEPFCLIHATVLRVLWKQHCRDVRTSTHKSAVELHAQVRRQVVNLADARLVQCEALEEQDHVSALPSKVNSVGGWHERWVDSGLMHLTHGKGRKVKANCI